MNPDVPQHGRSFRAAWLYYFHDKRGVGERERRTSSRVRFTRTVNLPTEDPAKAWKWMAYTALHQQEIKRAYGGDLRGRKMQRPLYAYSLNWHPSEDPSPEQMTDAALETLGFLGLGEHEAIFAAHSDREHPHIHVLVNKVHPETGRGPKLSNDYRRLQQWAYEYEKRLGKIYCRKREFNIVARRKKVERTDGSKTRVEPQQDVRSKKPEPLSAEVKAGLRQCGQMELSGTTPERTAEPVILRRDEDAAARAAQRVRALMRERWRELRERQHKELEELEAASTTPWRRLTYWFHHRHVRRGFLAGAFHALCGGRVLRLELRGAHRAQRRSLVQAFRTAARTPFGSTPRAVADAGPCDPVR